MFNGVKKAVVATALLLATSCDDLRDSYDHCGVWLEFVFDHNMEFVDSFGGHIDRVDVMVFDATGKLFSTLAAETDQLEGRKRMFLGGVGMPDGEYTIVTVGGLTDHFSLGGTANIEQMRLAVNYDRHVAHRFPHLWLGGSTKIDYRADLSVWRIPLLRLTNRFNIALQRTVRSSTTRAGNEEEATAPRFTFDITAPEQGAYDHRNQPVADGPLVYRPHTLSSSVTGATKGRGELHLSHGEINTMRLVADHPGGYTLTVREADSGEELWSHDLIDLIGNADPRDPDGKPIPLQEYLDRESNWNIVIVHDTGASPDEGFVALQVVVNGWIVWESGMEI